MHFRYYECYSYYVKCANSESTYNLGVTLLRCISCRDLCKNLLNPPIVPSLGLYT